MGDEQQNQPLATDRWGDPISDERKEELRHLAEQQREWAALPVGERGESRFSGVYLTGADVFWLAVQTLAGPTGDVGVVESRLRRPPEANEWRFQLDLSALHLEGANLEQAHLERASLYRVHLERASLRGARLEGAFLGGAHLEKVHLDGAHLEGASLYWLGPDLVTPSFDEVHLEGASLQAVHLERADLSYAHLESAFLDGAHLAGANLSAAHLEGAALHMASLQGASLNGAYLEGARLYGARLEGADLGAAHLEGKTYSVSDAEVARIRLWVPHFSTTLAPVDLTAASFDKNSRLNGAVLTGVMLDQVIFDNTNLTVVEWDRVQRLGDERAAHKARTVAEKIDGYHAAARANRALAVALRNQGLGGDATRFHYRAELMARYEQYYNLLARLFSRRFYTAPAAFGRWFFSWLLGAFAGYGDRLGRLFLTYLVTVSVFAVLMYAVAGRPPSFDSLRDVYVLSVTSFHGRGIQPPGLHLNDALATLTAVEAFFGLAIEGIFIAAFTRRVTGN